MIQPTMKIIDVRQIIQMVHDVVRAAKTVATGQCSDAGNRQRETNQGTHESPFPAGHYRCVIS